MTLPLFDREVPGGELNQCHARGCGVAVKPELLMCLAHWRKVPRKIQRAVWATYRAGQCDDKRPSRDWHQAASAAIAYVARAEGMSITVAEHDALVAVWGSDPGGTQ